MKNQRSPGSVNQHQQEFLAAFAWHCRSFEQHMNGIREPPYRSCSVLQATFALHGQRQQRQGRSPQGLQLERRSAIAAALSTRSDCIGSPCGWGMNAGYPKPAPAVPAARVMLRITLGTLLLFSVVGVGDKTIGGQVGVVHCSLMDRLNCQEHSQSCRSDSPAGGGVGDHMGNWDLTSRHQGLLLSPASQQPAKHRPGRFA